MTEIRKCVQCGKPLSIYNPKDTCLCHEMPKDYAGWPYKYNSVCTSKEPEGFNVAQRLYYGNTWS